MEDIKPLISRVLATDQGGEMTIRLKPENLGWVKVDVQVEQDSVRLSFQAEQGMAKDMLKSQLSDLKQQLSVAGLQLQEVSVGLMKSEGSEHQKSGEFQRGHGQHQESGSSKKEKEAKDFEEWAYEESRGSQAA
jgi:flagellar hook-length control protein FliK